MENDSPYVSHPRPKYISDMAFSLSSHHTVIKAFSPLKQNDENYKKQPSVTFIGEPGIDAGGLTR